MESQNKIGFLERMVCTIGLQAIACNLLPCIVAAGDALRSQTGNIVVYDDGGMYHSVIMTALLLLIVSISQLLRRSYVSIVMVAAMLCHARNLRALRCDSRPDYFVLITKALIILLLTHVIADIAHALGITSIITGLAILVIFYALHQAFVVDQLLSHFATYCVESLLQFVRSALGPAQFNIDCITDGYSIQVQP